MREDQFTKLYKFMSKRFSDLETKIDTKADAERVDQLYNLMDSIAKRLDDDATEQTITNDRHEGWIKQLADTTDAKLVPEL